MNCNYMYMKSPRKCILIVQNHKKTTWGFVFSDYVDTSTSVAKVPLVPNINTVVNSLASEHRDYSYLLFQLIAIVICLVLGVLIIFYRKKLKELCVIAKPRRRQGALRQEEHIVDDETGTEVAQ